MNTFLKKVLAFLLAMTMLFSVAAIFAGCEDSGKKKSSSSQKDDEDDEEEDEEEEEEKDDEEDEEEGNGKNDAWYDDKDDPSDEDDSSEETEPSGEDGPTGGNQVTPEVPVIGNFEVPAEGYDGSRVTITFANTMGTKLQSVLDSYIAEFNALYPNITVVHQSYGGWSDIERVISEEIIHDCQPNIAYCYPDHVAVYNQAWATVVLDDLINSQIELVRADGSTETLGLTQDQMDSFINGFYNEGKVYGDGLMYTWPMSKSTEVLYYNKTFFEANGLSVPTTWEEMETVCRQIKEIDPNSIPLGYDSESNLFITLCEQLGYDYVSATGSEKVLFNNDGCKAFVKELREWYQDGLITTQNLYGAYTSGLFTQLDKYSAHCYMSIGSTGGAFYQRPDNGAFEVGVASIPQVDPNNPKTISQGPSLCLLKGGNTSDQEIVASWLFMKFLTTNTAFQAEFSMASGYMPVNKFVYAHDYYSTWLYSGDGYDNLTAEVVRVGLENAYSYFVAPAFVGSSTVREQVGYLLAKCMSESTSNENSMIEDEFEKTYTQCMYRIN